MGRHAARGYDIQRHRTLQEPGTFWEYNDVRVNRASLALLRVWREALPGVLKREIMDPIGASDTWQWHGYRTSDVEVEGRTVTSVSGGGHWGGGLWISARDLARFGYLHLRRGRWIERQLLSKRWLDLALTPCDQNPSYGYMWWLNTNRRQWPSAPERSFAALGAGSNVVWVDPEHDLVVVLRWIESAAVDETLRRILAAITG
jgi:CubicO group peptidase (beta-lactamase class C family)